MSTNPYTLRKNVMSKEAKLAMSKWANRPNAADEAAKLSEQRRNLWHAINHYITERGGAVVSRQYESRFALRCRRILNCPLAYAKLAMTSFTEATEQRIRPPEPGKGGYGFCNRAIYHFKLAK